MLDRVLTVLRPALIDDGFQTKPGGETEYLKDVPCSAVPIKDGERFAGGEQRAHLTYRFAVRWSPKAAAILPTDRVAFEGRTFGIAGPVKEVGRREWIEITAGAQITTGPATS